MAIQGTSEKVTAELREGGNYTTSMNSSDYAAAVGSAQGVSWTGFLGFKQETSASGQAGIKYAFKAKMDQAVADYAKGINDEIDNMETNCSGIIAKAFSGTDVEKAVANLIQGLRDESKKYVGAITSATNQIILQVSNAYAKEDEAIGSSMDADTAVMRDGGTLPGSVTPGANDIPQ